jgi:mRNA-decapping enzyme subunit 2
VDFVSYSMSQPEPTLEQVFDDIEARFLYNLPSNELEQPERLFFQIEQAHWFYEDFKADMYSHLPHFATLKSFASKLFLHSALLSKSENKFQEFFSEFKQYKSKIPVYGCIMLNPPMTKMVLVCDYNGKSWTFPRGKINENETEFACALREVLEETGFDASPHCREEDSLLSYNEGKQIKLFVACNVPESTVFNTQTRKEIADIAFHAIDALPKTYAVIPFLEKMKRWIKKRKQYNAAMLKSPMNGNSQASISSKSPSRSTSAPNIAAAVSASGKTLPASSGSSKSSKNGGVQSNSVKRSPMMQQTSPPLRSANSHNALPPLPSPSCYAGSGSSSNNSAAGVARRTRNATDLHNYDTFADEGQDADQSFKGWGVNDMFAANAKITGKDYVYDGNPHQFGASHPKYVNYSESSAAGSGPSARASAAPAAPAGSSAGSSDVDPLQLLSQQSLVGHQFLCMDKKQQQHQHQAGGVAGSPSPSPSPSFSLHRPNDFSLPSSAFKFDSGVSGKFNARHDSFDSTFSQDAGSVDGVACSIVFPIKFKLDKKAIMLAFDSALNSAYRKP